ncbi:hypothetical protein COCNU_03G006350 [Cocos nucifera]|uniref:Uncharacterized protein n=1 Tax=Cocos nucifera TaxID=13894 RepID=A0A8K0I2T9_COCNU|nr:hypothetical protein COCNU_03G006340 [Cocos nucifera]KAG1334516.1 hypothetical protein COCNU_03G006350 [Cocos nucifera]
MEAMVASDKANLLFYTSSLALLKCFYNGETISCIAADGVINKSTKRFPRALRFCLIHVHEEEVVAARWLAQTTGRSKQHIEWDRP